MTPERQDPAGCRRGAALAGHQGDADGARRLLGDPAPEVRATALSAVARAGSPSAAEMAAALSDPSPTVRRRACEVAASTDHPAAADLQALLDDHDSGVVEAAAWALGERGPAAACTVGELAAVVRDHADPACREAAVAALGAIGDDRGLEAILRATRDKPAVRRRAVIALAPFVGPAVDEALARAATDRDWQVRQAAEDLADPQGGAPVS